MAVLDDRVAPADVASVQCRDQVVDRCEVGNADESGRQRRCALCKDGLKWRKDSPLKVFIREAQLSGSRYTTKDHDSSNKRQHVSLLAWAFLYGVEQGPPYGGGI